MSLLTSRGVLLCVVGIIVIHINSSNGDLMKRKQKAYFNEVEGLVDVFVGVCTKNDNEPDAKAGIGIWFNTFHPSNVGEPYEGLNPTHLKASMQGIRLAIRQAKAAGVYKLRIHINNKQVIDICQNYLDDWKQNNWYKSNGRVMKYKSELILLDEAIKSMDAIDFYYVKRVGLYDETLLAYTLAKMGGTKYLQKVLKPMWRATRSTTEEIITTIKEQFREVKKIRRNKITTE